MRRRSPHPTRKRCGLSARRSFVRTGGEGSPAGFAPPKDNAMTLRKKTPLIIGVTLITLIAALYATSSSILAGGFAQLEEQNTSQNVDRALKAFSNDLDTLRTTAGDYAFWDDAYAFIEDGN